MDTETKPSQTTESQRLPDEILFDILSRLPVLYLLQYRCVCKSWRSMISHPQFIKTQLHQSTQSLDSQRLLIAPPPNDYFTSLDCESCHESKLFDPPWMNWFSYGEVLCSCVGLILLCLRYRPFSSPNRNSHKTFVLWNPSIRKDFIFSCPYISIYSIELYGLCFDSSTNGYKVIILSQNGGRISILVFDLKSLSWKEIRDSTFVISYRQNGVIVKGASHWIMTSNQYYSGVIVYFDLMEEKLKELPKPDYWNKNDEFGLTVLRGWLCIYQWMDKKQLEVWAMKEYGKKESWTKLISIPAIIGSKSLCLCNPLCLTKTGEVLVLINKTEIAVYNPKECTLTTPWCLEDVRSFIAATYVESLVLLNYGNDTTKVQHRGGSESK